MEQLRVYRCALALGSFTITELADYSGVNRNTVRSLVTSRRRADFEVVGKEQPSGRGRPPQMFRLRDHDAVEAWLQQWLSAIQGVADPVAGSTALGRTELPDSDDLWSSDGSAPANSTSPEPVVRPHAQVVTSTAPMATSAPNDLFGLVQAACHGDNLAWTRLVGRYDGMLRAIARSYRLSPPDVDDAVQATWVQLYEHVDSIRDPGAVAAWLATTTRRQSLHVLQRRVREHLADDVAVGEAADAAEQPEYQALVSERRDALQRALRTLPTRERKLMQLLATDPDPDYRRIAAALDMPVGSIGPIRARSLERLQRNPELRDYVLQKVPQS